MGRYLNAYQARYKDLKKMLYNELMCSNHSKEEYVKYDANDIVSEEILEPMFDAIIGISLNKNVKEISEQITSLIDDYGVGDHTYIDEVALKLVEAQSEVRELFSKAKAEMIAQKDYENSPLKKLSDELDEYLRIGEEIEREEAVGQDNSQ